MILSGLEQAHQVADEGGAIGVYEASGNPGKERRRRARQGRAATNRKAFYIGNLAIGVTGQTSPLKPVSGSEIPLEGGHCMKLREGIPPTRPPS